MVEKLVCTLVCYKIMHDTEKNMLVLNKTLMTTLISIEYLKFSSDVCRQNL